MGDCNNTIGRHWKNVGSTIWICLFLNVYLGWSQMHCAMFLLLLGILIVCLLTLVRMVRLGRLDHLLSMENALFNIGGHFLGTSSEIQSLLLYQPVPVFSSVNIIQSQSLIQHVQSSDTFVHTQMSCAKKHSF